jgi:hypothetical protein
VDEEIRLGLGTYGHLILSGGQGFCHVGVPLLSEYHRSNLFYRVHLNLVGALEVVEGLPNEELQGMAREAGEEAG